MKWFAFFLFFFSWNVAQVQSDKNLLLKKANEELQYNPDKSQETATYILNNFPDKLSQSEAQFIFVKSLYYQNQLLRMFEQMTNSALPDDNNYILFSSIISSLGIKPEYYFENIKNSEIQYFEDLQTLTEARKYNDAKKNYPSADICNNYQKHTGTERILGFLFGCNSGRSDYFF